MVSIEAIVLWILICRGENLLDIVVPSYRYVLSFCCICPMFYVDLFL